MSHELPKLPYAYNALEPVIDEQTMRLHHDVHHAAYVKGLNLAEEKIAEARKSGDYGLIKHWERELAFHGSGHVLHVLFWTNLSPKGGGEPTGKLAEAIKQEWGSFDGFKKEFSAAANAVEGSGWGILTYNVPLKQLAILQVEKHQDLNQWGAVPLLVADVWEHAYYLKYQNKRGEYVDNLFKIFDWKEVEKRFGVHP
jgi:Fe-Mn family superoxide dismutase